MPFGMTGSEKCATAGAVGVVMCGTCPMCDKLRFMVTAAHVGRACLPGADVIAKVKTPSLDAALLVVRDGYADVFEGGWPIYNDWTTPRLQATGRVGIRHGGTPLRVEFAPGRHAIMDEIEIAKKLADTENPGMRVSKYGPMSGLTTGFLAGRGDLAAKSKACRCTNAEDDMAVLNALPGDKYPKACNTCCTKEQFSKAGEINFEETLIVLPENYEALATCSNTNASTDCPMQMPQDPQRFPTAAEAYKQCLMSASGDSGSIWFTWSDMHLHREEIIIRGAKAVCIHRGSGALTSAQTASGVTPRGFEAEHVYAANGCTPFSKALDIFLQDQFVKEELGLTDLHFCSIPERNDWLSQGAEERGKVSQQVIFADLAAAARAYEAGSVGASREG